MAPHSIRSAEALILALPSIAAVATAFLTGYPEEACASVLLVLPVTLASHVLTQHWRKRTPLGALYGMVLGVLARATVIVGGGLALYELTDEFKPRGVWLWGWLIGVYLSTWACELGVLLRSSRVGGSSR